MSCQKYAYRKLRLERLHVRANEKLSPLARAELRLEKKWQLRLDLVTIRIGVHERAIHLAKDDKRRWQAKQRLKRAHKRYSSLVEQFEKLKANRARAVLPAALPPLPY